MSPHICDLVRKPDSLHISNSRGTHRNWRRDGHDVALFNQQLSRAMAKLSDLRFGDRAAGSQLRDGSGKQPLASSGYSYILFGLRYLSRSLMMSRRGEAHAGLLEARTD